MVGTILMLLLTVGEAGPRPTPRPITYDVSRLVRAHSSRLPLIGGKAVTLPSIAYDKVLFVDESPNANWEHPAKFVFLKTGTVVLEVPARLPPAGLSRRHQVGPPKEREVPRFDISDFDKRYWIKNPSTYHAFLLNGHADERHWNDFAFLYRVLTRVYGYTPSNILVADGNFKAEAPDLDGNGTVDILYGSSKADVSGIFSTLSQTLKRGDRLLLVVNDHGSTQNGESTVILSDGEMTAREFAGHLGKLPSENVLSIFEQCFSGGFVRPTVLPNRVSMAASTDREISLANEEGTFDEFLYLIISAFGRQKHDGSPVHADSDGDGRVSAREAFSYGVANDKAWESPFMETHVNSNAGFTLGLD